MFDIPQFISRSIRFFIDEFTLSVIRENGYPKQFPFRIYEVFHSIQAKRNAVCEWK